ncbi:hypothetical protein UT300007_02260 [Clostridium sp. CTA-7]
MSVATFFKGLIDNNSMIVNKFIGYPSYLSSLETPMSDWLHILIARCITLFTNDYGLALNIFYLLTFPLTTITSLTVLLKLKISSFPSIIGSLLYTFIPYHFMRGENHIFLSAYYIVPLAIMLIIMIATEEDVFFSLKGDRYKFEFWNLRTCAIAILSLLIASSGVYYAYFSCFFLVLAGIIASFRVNNIRKFLSSIIIVFMIVLGCFINLVPHILYNANDGEKVSSVERSSTESEIYGLKIAQLLLPVTGHRINYLENKKDLYEQRAPLVNENGTAALGIIGSIGFLISLAYIYIDRNDKLIRNIGLLNLGAVLLATIGGFSTIVAFLLTDMIRSYNRISVFISFFSIIVVVHLLDKIYKKFENNRKIMFILGILVISIGIYDQTSPRFIPKYNEISLEYNEDAKFINTIEKNTELGSKILQLPYIPFPEEPSLFKMEYYDMLKPYLHSKQLYWSYGSIKGKQNDLWLKEVSQKSPEELVEDISNKGFNGIFIDKFGYENEEELKNIINRISNIGGNSPIYSNNNRYVFIKLNI